MFAREVSKFVNSAKIDDARCGTPAFPKPNFLNVQDTNDAENLLLVLLLKPAF